MQSDSRKTRLIEIADEISREGHNGWGNEIRSILAEFAASGDGTEAPTPQLRDYMLQFRDIEEPCPKCDGWGKTAYANTATWRGGIYVRAAEYERGRLAGREEAAKRVDEEADWHFSMQGRSAISSYHHKARAADFRRVAAAIRSLAPQPGQPAKETTK